MPTSPTSQTVKGSAHRTKNLSSPRNRPMGCRDAARVLFIFASVSAFKLLDVGAPRTGTQSMFDAMRILGLHPMHSGYDTWKKLRLS